MDPSSKRPLPTKSDKPTTKKPKKNTNDSPSTTKPEPSKKPLNPDTELQRQLLETNKDLARLFVQALKEKPEGVSQKQLARQFWATRDHLLRAHAFERDQKRADYNVLSEVKPRNVEGAIKLNITPEQVEDIFRQHPVVRTAYNDTVPNKYASNMDFWSAFFVSRLFKKLKGERITEGDHQNPTLDRYLNNEHEARIEQDSPEQHIPHFIDLEGNEQNHSQRKGNQADFTMRPNASEKMPILRILNSMSEKIMAHVSPADGKRYAPIGMDEETYNQLRLRDLQGESGGDEVRLTIRDQQLHTGHNSASKSQAEAQPQPQTNPRKALSSIQRELSSASNTAAGPNSMDLTSGLGHPDDSDDDSDDDDSNDEDEADKSTNPTRTAFDTSLTRSNTQIQSLINAQLDKFSSTTSPSTRGAIPTVAATLSMTPLALQDLILTHQTTNEFLHYFWHLLLTSRSASTELPPLLGTLEKSLERMRAAAEVQEKERKGRLAVLKHKAAEEQARFRTNVRVDEKEAGPGKREVEWLLEPMVRAIGVAKDRFEQTMVAEGAAVAR